MIRFFTLSCLMFVYSLRLFSQTEFTFESSPYSISKTFTKNPQSSIDWHLQIQNLEAPKEFNQTYQSYLRQLKIEIEKRFPRNENIENHYLKTEEKPPLPEIGEQIEGNVYNGGAPNDNTLAISNDGIIVSSINTNLIFYNTTNDSLLASMSLNSFCDTLTTVSSHQYDPKLIYDYLSDRFILVFLSGGSSDTNTNIIVAFSTSKNPMDAWNIYTISGNPLNDTSWSDFPAISLSNNELFITMNLLRYGGSWQTSFKQSIIWQVDKNSGYLGQNLKLNLFKNINFGGVPIRNMHPVVGGNAFYGPEMYFMSNRNFSVQCDSFFLLKTSGTINSSPSLECKLFQSDNKYGAPPNARQAGNKWLATNDARVLGAFKQNNSIQFVGNTIDTVSGKASCYHGIIADISKQDIIPLKIFKDTVEFGYPNISYCGNGVNQQSIISLNYTSGTVYAGLGAINYDGKGFFSDIKIIKSGETYINVLLAGLQRWGDYSGSQPKYNEKGTVWISGTYGKLVGTSRRYGTWIAALSTNVENIPKPSENSLKLFPNPITNNLVFLEISMMETSEINIDVIGLDGKIIYSVYKGILNYGTNQISFSTVPLQAGSYIIRVRTDAEIISSKKLTVL